MLIYLVVIKKKKKNTQNVIVIKLKFDLKRVKIIFKYISDS